MGKGQVASKADNLGGMIKAQGTHGTKGTTSHKG